MDGNGRWARQRGLPRIEGHQRGVQSVRATVEECCRLGIEQLTLYCLSIENWKRPQHELDFLMTLLSKYLGTVRIIDVRTNEAVAQPVGKMLAPIKVGDEVASRILGG